MSKKSELAERIKSRLGYPQIKVELADEQIYNHIDFARHRFVRWASGNATQEVWFTMMLSAGQYLYDMPPNVVDVLEYDASASVTGGINTLFTLQNYLYTHGMFGILDPSSNTGYNLVGYHMVRDFLETLERYSPDAYNFKYHAYSNQLEIQPPPPSGNSFLWTTAGKTFDSPGFILIRAVRIESSQLPGSFDDDMFDHMWVEDYATAKCKETLGLIRRKFANFSALGNQGAALDGDALVTEGKAEQDELLIKLRDQETHKGMGMIVG